MTTTLHRDGGGRLYRRTIEGAQERRRYADGSLTILSLRRRAGTMRVLLHTGPDPRHAFTPGVE